MIVRHPALGKTPVSLALLPWIVALAVLAAAACGPRSNPETSTTFAGATIRVIVGFPAGGGYDLHARVLARHLGRFLPGEPSVVVENMPGAGGALAATFLSTAAAPDGLTIGILGEASAPDLVDSKLLERLALLGSPGASQPVIAFTKRSGIGSIDDWRRAATPPRVGATGGRSLSFVVSRIAVKALNLPAQIVAGYAGTSEVRLAFESGEVDAYSFDESVVRSDQLGEGVTVLRFGDPSASSRDAADGLSLAPDATARRLLETGIYDMRPFGRVFAAPRAVPQERLALLRTAVAKTFADPVFLGEAKTAGLAIAPIEVEAIERAAARLTESIDDRLRNIVRVD